MQNNYYVAGQWNCICDRCGFKRKSGDMSKTWEGWMVCTDTCWEPKHPQLFVKGVPDNIVPPWTRPEAPDRFVHTMNTVRNYCNDSCNPEITNKQTPNA